MIAVDANSLIAAASPLQSIQGLTAQQVIIWLLAQWANSGIENQVILGKVTLGQNIGFGYPLNISAGTTAGASIYYTTDGSTPSATNGTLYNFSAEPSIPAGTVVNVIAVLAGWLPSAIQTVIAPGGGLGSFDASSLLVNGGEYQTSVAAGEYFYVNGILVTPGATPFFYSTGEDILYRGPIGAIQSTLKIYPFTGANLLNGQNYS